MVSDINENDGFAAPEPIDPRVTAGDSGQRGYAQDFESITPVGQDNLGNAGSAPPVEAEYRENAGSAPPVEAEYRENAENAPPAGGWSPPPEAARVTLGERLSMPHVNDWQEPAYSQTQEPIYNMYTPGIRISHTLPAARAIPAKKAKKISYASKSPGRFLRTACIVLLCVILSGASAYGVTEFRVRRGDFEAIVNNQVVLGGTHNTQDAGPLSPVSTTGGEISAEDIYDMALYQVVKINTETNDAGGAFTTQTSGTIVSGSGFIISSDGYILTNYHVIETAHANTIPLIVYLNDGSSFEAKIIGFDSDSDFAVIKIEATGLNPAVLGDSDSIRVGQRVYAVGNPFGDLLYTMTDGIISALDRVVTVERKTISTFQFSAAVNSGNSGGPVYNAKGEVIGIVTAKMMRDSVEGIGFAIPINDAISVASDLIEHGYITGRPLLGITVDNAGIKTDSFNSGQAYYYGSGVGAIVMSVTPGSAAEKAGIEIGDIITALGDTPVDSSSSLIFNLRKYNAGDTVTLTVLRGDEEIEILITFDEKLTAGQP